MNFHIRTCLAVVLALGLCSAVRADTMIMKNGESLEVKVLSEDGKAVEVEVVTDKAEHSVMRVPRSRILRIEEDTPEKIAARETKAAEEKDLAERMKDEGKVLYKGKWVTEEEKKKEEAKLAAAKKKRDEERAKARKEAEVAAKRKEEEEKRRQQEMQQQATANSQLQNLNSRAARFEQQHWRDGSYYNSNSSNQSSYGSNYGHTSNSGPASGGYGGSLNSLMQRGRSMLNNR